MEHIGQKLINYALTLGEVYVDYPFGPDIATVRHKSNKKIFLFLMQYKNERVANLKCEPMKAAFWRSVYTAVQPGYHMGNKAAWNTVFLNGGLPQAVLEEMVCDSFAITKNAKTPRAKRGI